MSRLETFRNSEGMRKAYRTAISTLLELGIDTLLLELAFNTEVLSSHPNVIEANALENQRRLGYVEAINTLFQLEEVTVSSRIIDVPRDYGARDALVAQGKVTTEEMEQFEREN